MKTTLHLCIKLLLWSTIVTNGLFISLCHPKWGTHKTGFSEPVFHIFWLIIINKILLFCRRFKHLP